MSNGRPYRSSLFAGFLLILLGVVFFTDRVYPGLGIGHLIRIYWPVLLILWGAAKLLDQLSIRDSGGTRSSILSGGEAVLLALLAIVLGAFVFRDWLRDHAPGLGFELPPFHESYSEAIPLAPRALGPGTRVTIATGRGDVTVHASDGNNLVVSATKSGPGTSESSAEQGMGQVEVAIEPQGGGVLIHPIRMDTAPRGVSVDIEVRVPKLSPLAIDTAHGDVSVSGISAPISVRSGKGDTEIRDAGSDVFVQSESGDVRISGVGANVHLAGRGDDVEIDNVSGNATVEGAFAGDIKLKNIAKTARCATQFSDLTVNQLTGHMEMSSDDISVSGANGDVSLVTRNKDIAVDHVSGQLSVVDSHSDIDVKYDAPPRADIRIVNESADVDLTLPPDSNFFLTAVSRSGEVSSDFEGPGLRPVNDEEVQQLSGQFGSGGPRISISTTYGTVQISKSR